MLFLPLLSIRNKFQKFSIPINCYIAVQFTIFATFMFLPALRYSGLCASKVNTSINRKRLKEQKKRVNDKTKLQKTIIFDFKFKLNQLNYILLIFTKLILSYKHILTNTINMISYYRPFPLLVKPIIFPSLFSFESFFVCVCVSRFLLLFVAITFSM